MGIMSTIHALSEIGVKKCDVSVTRKDFIELRMEISRIMNLSEKKAEFNYPGDYKTTEITFIHRGVEMNIRYE